MRLPIPPQKQKIFDIDEFEAEEVDCANCKHYHEQLIADQIHVDCDSNFMCAKELMEEGEEDAETLKELADIVTNLTSEEKQYIKQMWEENKKVFCGIGEEE